MFSKNIEENKISCNKDNRLLNDNGNFYFVIHLPGFRFIARQKRNYKIPHKYVALWHCTKVNRKIVALLTDFFYKKRSLDISPCTAYRFLIKISILLLLFTASAVVKVQFFYVEKIKVIRIL